MTLAWAWMLRLWVQQRAWARGTALVWAALGAGLAHGMASGMEMVHGILKKS